MGRSRKKVSFEGQNGQQLSGVIEFPPDQEPYTYAIFVHCFTCGKNVSAARRIASSLAQNGIAVLRFDFTGIGESKGEFSETNFKSNLGDVVAAVEFLKSSFEAPTMIIGHSLGGAAALASSFDLDQIKAVVTIGSPADPYHVTELLRGELDEIEKSGHGKVTIGAREFEIKSQFIQDLKKHDFLPRLKNLKKPLLILHSPQDEIVSIDNAAELYKHAFHPKSFITLDGADHMLSEAVDANYVGEIIGTWIRKYVPGPDLPGLKTDHQVVASSQSDDGYTTFIRTGDHRITADEPADVGGNNYGPSPYELLSSALAACTAMTMRMYADRKDWPLSECRVHVNHEKKHANDSNSSKDKIDTFYRSIEIIGDLNEKQHDRLMEIANRCPVHRTLESQSISIETVERSNTD